MEIFLGNAVKDIHLRSKKETELNWKGLLRDALTSYQIYGEIFEDFEKYRQFFLQIFYILSAIHFQL